MPINRLLKYYTPKSGLLQANLDIFTIFVNYADFYVNTIMLTAATKAVKILSFSIIFLDIDRGSAYTSLDIVFARNLSFFEW